MLTEPRNNKVINLAEESSYLRYHHLIGIYKMLKDFSDYFKIKFAWILLNDFADFHNKCGKHFSYGM